MFARFRSLIDDVVEVTKETGMLSVIGRCFREMFNVKSKNVARDGVLGVTGE